MPITIPHKKYETALSRISYSPYNHNVLQSQLFYAFVLCGSIQALTVFSVVYKYNITLVIVYTYDIAASA